MRRSLLFIPGSDLKKQGKAPGLPCDAVIFDLEDSVSLDLKDTARENARSFLKSMRKNAPHLEIVLRINSLDTMLGIRDFLELVALRPDTLLLPKACLRHTIMANDLMTLLEQEHGLPPNCVRLMLLVETAEGLETVGACLQAAFGRVCAVQLGAEDLTQELGIKRTTQGRELIYARSRIVMAARMAGVDPIDTPYANFRDEEGLRMDLAEAKALGMIGKTAIHPAQIPIINESFIPSAEEIVQAQRIIGAYESSIKSGKGVCQLDGKMIDLPIVKKAENVLQTASALGLM